MLGFRKTRLYRKLVNIRLQILVIVLISGLQIFLRLVGFKKVLGYIQRYDKSLTVSSERVHITPPNLVSKIIARYQRYIERVSQKKWVVGLCLSKSLALYILLLRKNIKPSICFGQKKNAQGGLEAHAWLELDGAVINDAPDIGLEYMKFDQPLDNATKNMGS